MLVVIVGDKDEHAMASIPPENSTGGLFPSLGAFLVFGRSPNIVIVTPFAVWRDEGMRKDTLGDGSLDGGESIVTNIWVSGVSVSPSASGIADARKPFAGSYDPIIRTVDETVSVAFTFGKAAVIRFNLTINKCVNVSL